MSLYIQRIDIAIGQKITQAIVRISFVWREREKFVTSPLTNYRRDQKEKQERIQAIPSQMNFSINSVRRKSSFDLNL